MPTAPSQLEYLLTTPSETLNVELKCWIDPQEPASAAKIVKGCLALRNRNGGYLVVGVDDKSRRPEPHPGGWDAAERFHVDRVQDLISRHASERFEVEVVFVPSAAGAHPVIVVPSGVRAPVALKQALADAAGKPLLKVGEVPFRTLNANGRVSTAAARPEDWPELVGICFDNREADVAGFLRRHLAAVTPDLLRALSAGLAAEPPSRNLGARAMDWLETGRKRFALVSAEVDVRVKAEWGGWEAGLVINPPLPDPTPDQAFLNRIYAANPSYSGWPIWHDLRGVSGVTTAVRAGGWEVLAAFDGWYDVFDFYRFEGEGRLYARRPYFDDGIAASRGSRPNAILDPVPLLADIAEAISVGLRIASALGTEPDGELAFAFRWSGLKERRLSTLSPQELGNVLFGGPRCDEPEVSSTVVVPAATSPLAVATFAYRATRSLFSAFNGFAVTEAAVDRIAAARLQRRTL